MVDVPISSPLHTLWRAPVLLWVLLIAEGLAAVMTLAPAAGGDRLIYFGLASMLAQWIALLTLGALYLLRGFMGKLRPLALAYGTFVLLLGCATLVALATWALLHDAWPISPIQWQGLFIRLLGILVIVGLLGLGAFQNYWQAQQLAVRYRQAELEILQARIHPHFLFNTLNTGAALVRAQPEKAEQLLLDLSDLFRASLSAPRAVPLSEELALTQRYLEIELLRLDRRLQLHWQVPDNLPAVSVPILSIQPLVENAVRHGVEPSPGGGRVEVIVELEVSAQLIRITIANDLYSGPTLTAGHNVGLISARERISAMAGASMLTEHVEGRHIVTILLPLPAAS